MELKLKGRRNERKRKEKRCWRDNIEWGHPEKKGAAGEIKGKGEEEERGPRGRRGEQGVMKSISVKTLK